MIDTVRQMSGEDITVPFAWTLATANTPHRIWEAANVTVYAAQSDRLAVFALAIARFKEQHNRWPDTVLELPNQADAVDPVTDQPFRYTASESDQFPVCGFSSAERQRSGF